MNSVWRAQKAGGSHGLVWAALTVMAGMMIAAAQVHAAAPLVLQAQSSKPHGLAGPFDLDVHTIGAVECRLGGPTQLRLTFDRPVQGVGGLSTNDVTLSSGTVTGVAIDGSTLTIDMAGCADGSLLNVAFPGIADAADAGTMVEDVLCFGVLAGDVNGDQSTNILDLVTIRNNLNAAVGSDNFRADLNADGTINILDLVATRNNLNKTISGTCIGPVPPGMVLIPAGEFLMGNSFDPSEGYPEELPRHAVYVDALYMDRTEVTNQQYAAALNWACGQGGLITVTSGVVYKYNSGTSYPYCDTTTSSSYSRITWNGSTFGVTSGKENHPMVMVSWYGSVAYANWRSAMQGKPLGYDLSTWECNWGNGYRLPTEAEWEKAARGGVAGHRFPWSDSDDIQHARANYYSSDPRYSYDTSPTRGYHPTFNTGVMPYTSPAGYFAANGYGLCDMAGNVLEWCNDRYGGTYYSTTPYPHNNPRGPTSGPFRVLRGGSWDSGTPCARCAYRSFLAPSHRNYGNGLRLVARAALDAP